jgi:hypothetical protein
MDRPRTVSAWLVDGSSDTVGADERVKTFWVFSRKAAGNLESWAGGWMARQAASDGGVEGIRPTRSDCGSVDAIGPAGRCAR